MKVTLHMATSIDGYIAGAEGNSDWVSAINEELFTRRCRDAGAMVVGRCTYEQYLGSLYPIAKTDNIILSRMTPVTTTSEAPENVHYVRSPLDAIDKARRLKHNALLVSGGAQVSTAFLDVGFLDEIFLSVHPIILGKGMRLFDGAKLEEAFFLEDVQKLGDGLAQLHYLKNR